VFITLEGPFKPTVIFFRLTNFPAMFLTIMNEILQDLINTGEVMIFICNVIVGIEEEKGHDKGVEEVVKRIIK